MAQLIKNLPAMQETWVWSLDQEDPLEKGVATHSSILASEIPWTEEPSGLQSMGSQESDLTYPPLSICWTLVKSRQQCFIELWTQPVNFQTKGKAHCKQIKQELSIFEVIKLTEICKFKSCPTQASISFVLLNVTSSLPFLHGSCYPAGIG